ncbi:flagellar biosynthesis protein FlhB [Alteromonas sp. 5E99-2]|uniref:flagellar biosynthesis protein FlhB n=1 Tax=Alteromonas sp. 5E99-2 TaxID=2817683 RepID=UPI001A9939C4|nr:flagellar biosynthesis protein FlhB [Alteromonas sp. 5E99-2]MBO1255217.1 flagellar biosynthesis protein FlhB [Alteromonas sp. 5E99-2]
MEQSSEKTEEPTAKKIEDARKKGQLARSRELSTVLVLAASAIALLIFGGIVAESLFSVMGSLFELSRDETYDPLHMFQALQYSIDRVKVPVIMFLVIGMVAGVYGSIALGGFNFTWESAEPKWSKLSPMAGFKRMFGTNGLVELVKSIAKILVIATATMTALYLYRNEAIHLDLENYPANLFHAMDMIQWAFLILCLSLIPVAVIDVPYQMHKHNEELKMTKQEVKDEHKNSDGDPQTKGRIRKLQYQAAANRMMQAVPDADVVVTNPTHYSVALKYQDDGDMAPVVVAKGADELAMHIRKIATAHDVPLIPSPMLARAIFYSTEVDHPIPHGLFMAVAQVLAYVYQLKRFKSGKGKRPNPLSKTLPIPPELRR